MTSVSTVAEPVYQSPISTRDAVDAGPVAAGVVVVHSGARDRYQVALALSQAGMLHCLVTDFFWSEDTLAGRLLARCLPGGLLSVLRRRSAPGLPKSKVKTHLTSALGSFLLDKAGWLSFDARRWLMRNADARLGRRAGSIARRSGSELLSYSYYAFHAFRALGRGGMLFQMHPHPVAMRSLLLAELYINPDCAESLLQEWELSLPPMDFQRLVQETTMSSTSLAASSFTRSTLIAHGAAPSSVQVVPYGIDLQKFHPDHDRQRTTCGPLRLLFVGRINQRKGIKYLLQAIALLPDADLELTVCGRVMDGLDLFAQEAGRVRIRPSVSNEELIREYQQADLFVLPSIGEGFGQVLLEALACGLPVLATTHTAAPDLIRDGVEGFIVEPQRAEQLADRIAWALAHRDLLADMRPAARSCAERFPWSRFQAEVVRSVRMSVAQSKAVAEVG